MITLGIILLDKQFAYYLREGKDTELQELRESIYINQIRFWLGRVREFSRVKQEIDYLHFDLCLYFVSD